MSDTKKHSSQQSVNQAIKSICDIMRRANCQGAMQYVPELTWILFLRILDELEQQEADNAEIQGNNYTPSLTSPYRWQDWAAPFDETLFRKNPNAKEQGWKRYELQKTSTVKDWVNNDLIPHLKNLQNQATTQRQKVISQIMSGVENTRIDSDYNLLEILDKVHALSNHSVDNQHVFTLSQVYEGLLLSMGEKGNDGGQFFTPREVIRMMVKVINPHIGQTVYDPCCGTGGFLAQTMEFMAGKSENGSLFSGKTPDEIDILKHSTFYGREKDNQVYPIALANLILHGIDLPHLWHGNTLLEEESYGGLYEDAPVTFDVILTNPPFGGKESGRVKDKYGTSATQMCFLEHVQESLKEGGQCAIVMDEGVLFRTNESEFVAIKRRLLRDCNLWCIVSLPSGVFTSAGAGVKTNVLFFKAGEETKNIWYYDLSAVKVGKRTPLTLEHFEDFFKHLPQRSDSENSWTIDFSLRQKEAENKALPLEEQAKEKKDTVASLKKQLKNKGGLFLLQNATPSDELEPQINALEKEINELDNKIKSIRNAVYDLKAVNPNLKDTSDQRTPQELLEIIALHGKEISQLLAQLE